MECGPVTYPSNFFILLLRNCNQMKWNQTLFVVSHNITTYNTRKQICRQDVTSMMPRLRRLPHLLTPQKKTHCYATT